jgi:hypothetical protein
MVIRERFSIVYALGKLEAELEKKGGVGSFLEPENLTRLLVEPCECRGYGGYGSDQY